MKRRIALLCMGNEGFDRNYFKVTDSDLYRLLDNHSVKLVAIQHP
jgi:hypothetical protein